MVEQKIKHSFPDDWNLEPFYLISSMNGRIGWQGLKQSEFTQNPDDPFLITGMNFKDGKIRWDEVYHILKKRYDEAKNIQLKKDDVLITKDGTIGKVLFVDNIPYPHKASLNSHLLVFRPLRKKYEPKFLFYQLQSKPFLEHIEENKSGTTFFGITEKSIGKYNAFLPPMPEQEAISESLSDIDNLIDSLESLIEKKKNIKQGTMQELLTGKRKLKGFSNEWVEREIRQIAVIEKGKGLSKGKMDPDGQFKCVLYGELFTKYSEVIKNIVSSTNFKEGILSEYGDILIPGSTTTVGIDLASSSVILEKNVRLGGDINIIRLNSKILNPIFASYYITNLLQNEIARITKGITIIHLHGKDLKRLKIKFPKEHNTQLKIIEIIQDMDSEIEQLEKQLEKYTNLKQAMMQKLLTGEIRLN